MTVPPQIRAVDVRRAEPTFIAGLCLYELAGLAGLWPPLTDRFRRHPATFAAFVAYVTWHTWLKSGAPMHGRVRRGR